MSQRDRLIALLQDPVKQALYRTRGRALAGQVEHTGGPTSHNACAATACQVLLPAELGILSKPYTLVEPLANAMKAHGFIGTDDWTKADAGVAVVCGNSDGKRHIWWIVRKAPHGLFVCLDNQGNGLTHLRGLHGEFGKTPARGLLYLPT